MMMRELRIVRTFLWIALLTGITCGTIRPAAFASNDVEAPTEDADRETAPRYDLVIYGATPGGVACAVRAAREKLDVLLVSHSEHLGGMLTSGLSTMDTLYNGQRAPVYDELRARIYGYYRENYGVDSQQLQAAQPRHPKTRYEARVVERLINELLAAESRIAVIRSYYPVATARDAALLRSVTFRQMNGTGTLTAIADAFADCSYEADLAAVAEVACRVGRESRDEFNEPHAGVIYMRRVPWPPEHVDTEDMLLCRRLNLFRYQEWYETICDVSTGAADPAVQGFNMRTIITSHPENRIIPERPRNYNPESFRTFGFGNPESPGLSMPNRKFGMNEPKLVGQQDPYVEGDWQTRRSVTQQHRDATLGLLWFRQNDPSVPEPIRRQWREYGLPKDEFPDNDHMPYEIYARETRRIKGRAVFTQNDAQLAAELHRAPIHPDSISITEWFLDSHACTPRRVGDSQYEGMVMLKNQTFPGQVSYETILPTEFDNLLVPVCLSASHVGWGTIRLEPTWMSIGEAAAHAVAMAKRKNVTPAAIHKDDLVRLLAERHVMLSFFNDVEGRTDEDWYSAVQYFGTQGCFGSYDARSDDLLTENTADAWAEVFGHTAQGENKTTSKSAKRSLAAEQNPGPPVTAREFARRLTSALALEDPGEVLLVRLMAELRIPPEESISRGTACRLMFAALPR